MKNFANGEKDINAKEYFFDYINQKVKISEAVKDSLFLAVEEHSVNKNHFLAKEGRIPDYLWFIAKGSVRVFYWHSDKEITSWIYNEGQFVTAYGSFFSRTPSYDNIQCTEDCTVIKISYDNLQKLYAEHSQMQKFGRVLMEDIVTSIDNFYKGFMFMSAKEKYDLLLSYFPDVVQRVNLGHIASFLGISQETLSRIRNKRN